MNYKKNILMYVWAAMLFIGSLTQLPAQEFTTVSFTDVRPGSEVKGIYLLEAGESSGFYLKEEADGTLTSAAFDAADEHFYFWVSENLKR